MQFLKSLRLNELLSFAPASEAITLTPLNVLIGPNGSGKSNLIEAIELLHATPTAFASAIRDGGGVREWLWKGKGGTGNASIEASISGSQFIHSKQPIKDLRYLLRFTASGYRTEVTEEVLEEKEKRRSDAKDVFFFYRYKSGNAFINVREKTDKERAESHHNVRHLERQTSYLTSLCFPSGRSRISIRN
jgi:predicted ATPase